MSITSERHPIQLSISRIDLINHIRKNFRGDIAYILIQNIDKYEKWYREVVSNYFNSEITTAELNDLLFRALVKYTGDVEH